MLKLEKNVIFASVAILVLAVGALIYSIFGAGLRLPGCVTIDKAFTRGDLVQKAPGLYELHMLAKMWVFEPQVIKVKPNSTIDIYLASQDVNHGFQIENTNVNLMAVPGAVNYARVTLREPGIYHVVCHEYCGVGHQNMAAAIVVSADVDQPQLLAQLDQSVGASHEPIDSNPGKSLFASKGCVACHSLDGAKLTGPTFKGLFGRREKLADGSIVLVDEAYIKESIQAPAAKIVFGFQPIMPKLEVSDQEVTQIISYIKTLKEEKNVP